jgi:hypothetical protein
MVELDPPARRVGWWRRAPCRVPWALAGAAIVVAAGLALLLAGLLHAVRDVDARGFEGRGP